MPLCPHMPLCPLYLHLGVRVKICKFRFGSLIGKLGGVETRKCPGVTLWSFRKGPVTPKWLDYEEKVVTTFNQAEDFLLHVWVFTCLYVCIPYMCLAPVVATRRDQMTWD